MRKDDVLIGNPGVGMQSAAAALEAQREQLALHGVDLKPLPAPYHRNLKALARADLAAWGHREEIRWRGRTIRRGTVAIGSVEDWERHRFLLRRRIMYLQWIVNAARFAAAARRIGITFAEAARAAENAGRALSRALSRAVADDPEAA